MMKLILFGVMVAILLMGCSEQKAQQPSITPSPTHTVSASPTFQLPTYIPDDLVADQSDKSIEELEIVG